MDVKEPALLRRLVKMVADKGMTNEVCYFVGSTYIDNILEYNKDAIPFPWVSNTTDVNNYQKYYAKSIPGGIHYHFLPSSEVLSSVQPSTY